LSEKCYYKYSIPEQSFRKFVKSRAPFNFMRFSVADGSGRFYLMRAKRYNGGIIGIERELRMAAITNANAKETVMAKKLEALRERLCAHNLDAWLIPSVDEHINEYLPKNRERRAWASGFTGSSGDFLVAMHEAWLFVDSRYHEQADTEVALGQIHVSKLGLEGQPGLSEKIKALAEGSQRFRLGFDPFTLTVQQYQSFKKSFESTTIELAPVSENLVDTLWEDPPPPVLSEVFAIPESISGKGWQQKLAEVQDKMKALKIEVLPVTKLDQIAWLFNLRGQDISYNPVFIAYAIVTADQAHLFIDASRMQPKALEDLASRVGIHPYEDYRKRLSEHCNVKTVLIDPKHTTAGTLFIVEQHGGMVREAEHPIEMMKALKNETEIRMMQAANLKASRGKIRAWFWLERQIQSGRAVTEASFRDAIEGFYAEEQDFMGLSFNTISGAGSNSSIVHYGTPDPAKTLEKGELFLIDSGCQFLGGTTDDTRTMFIGSGQAGETPTERQKLCYTEVLKAHINCAMQRFPKGTEGARLDGVTRYTLWQNGLDYGHGTGHGVGAFLNVHEGPNGIHKLAAKPLEPGMITSIEPGYYQPGWGGIRLENLYRVIELETDGTGTKWYGFESLIYIPFDQQLIDFSRLNPEQLQWLRAYYAAIVEKIAPTLAPDETAWLKDICTIG
jgi:Xaa-Pro aminopeptidase